MAGETSTPKAKRSRLRRWLRWGVLIGLLLAVTLRAGIVFFLPGILDSVASKRGLAIGYQKLDLSVFTGDLELWGLEVRKASEAEEEPGELLTELEFLTADVDVSSLLFGDLVVHRAEIDGIDVHARRENMEAGWSFEGLLAAEETRPEAEEEEPEPETEDEEFAGYDLGLPVELRALRLQHLQLHIHDGARKPAYDTRLELNVRLSDLGRDDRPARLEVYSHASGWLDALEVDGRITTTPDNLEASLACQLRGLRPQELEPYLALVGLRPDAERIGMGMTCEVRARVSDESAQSLDLVAALNGIQVTADGAECMGVDSLQLALPHLSPTRIDVQTSTLKGVRARVRRTEAGEISVAGLQLTPAPSTRPVPAATAVEDPVDSSSQADGTSEALPELSIADLRLEDFGFTLEDRALPTATELEWRISEASLRDIQLSPGHAIRVEASMHSPEVFEELKIAGELVPMGETRSCELGMQVSGIQPERLAPYLGALGLESTFDAGNFHGNLTAEVRESGDHVLDIGLRLGDIQLEDTEELLGLDAVALSGVRIDTRDGSVQVEEVLLDGSRLSVERDEEGDFRFLGLATGAVKTAAAASPDGSPAAPEVVVDTPEAAAAPAGSEPLPRIAVDRVAWSNTRIQFLDRSLEPARALTLDQLGFELTDLELGGPEGGAAPAPANFRLFFQSEGLAQELGCSGTLTSTPGPLNLELALALRGQGLSYRALEPWMEELGIEPRLDQGELNMDLDARIRDVDGETHASLEIRDAHFRSGEDTYLALNALRLPSLRIDGQGTHVDELRIEAPLLRLERDAQGALMLLGLRIPVPEPQAEAEASVPVEQTATPATPEAPAASPSPSVFELGHLALDSARIEWADAALGEPIASALTLDLSADRLALGGPAAPADFDVRMGIEGALDQLRLTGTVGLDPDHIELDSSLSMQGLRAGSLTPYLPDGLEVPLRAGQFDGKLAAGFERRDDGLGHAARFELAAFDYRDADAPLPLMAVERMAVTIPRLDPAAGHFEISEVVLTGLEVDSRRSPEGQLRILGLGLGGTSSESRSSADPTEPAPLSEVSTVHAATSVAKTPDQPAPQPVESIPPTGQVADETPVTPTVLLGDLDLGIAHFRYLDETEAGATPLDLTLRLGVPRAQTLISPEAENLPPLEFSIEGSATPILAEGNARLQLTPFDHEPGFKMEYSLNGIRGEGLTEVLPALAETLDGSALPDGLVESSLDANLLLRRRSPVDFDLSSGFGVELEMQKMALLDRPGGEELVALGGMNASVKSIRPGSGQVHVERIELVEPKLHASKTPEGLRALGFLIKAPTEAEDPEASEGEASEVPEDGTVAQASEDPRAEPDGTSAEFRLDELLISGADFAFTDTSVEPPMQLPVADFDLEFKGFSTRTLEEERPFRFNATLYGDDVQLPKRHAAGNFVGGVLGSLAALGSGEKVEIEDRPVFDEIMLRGNLSLGPQPKGYTQLRVRALELPTFRGAALESGVEIGDGLLNESVMLRFDGAGGMQVSSKTNISYLSLSEPPGGPISSYLKLPAPLDTVLFVLRDEEGDQNIPLDLKIDEGGLKTSTILAAVSRTLGLVIGDAIASSPMKIVGGVLDMAGIEDTPVELEGDEIVALEFAKGDVGTPSEMGERLAPLLDLLRRDPSFYLVVEHQLSEEDLACCDLLANPPAADCLDLAENLRRKRTSLLAERERSAASLREAHSMGNVQEATFSRQSLRAIERNLGSIESALDRLFELTRPGAERGRARRARGTALEVAQRRLDSVAETLRRAPIPRIGTRVDVRRPRFGVTPDLALGTVLVSVHRRR